MQSRTAKTCHIIVHTSSCSRTVQWVDADEYRFKPRDFVSSS